MAQPRYVTICGGTGGAGTTSLAVNLAACFTRLGLGRVLLVDAGLPVPGDASLLSGVETPRALAHLASIAHSIAPTLFETYLSRSSAGVSIINLCADAVDEAAVTHVLLHRLIALADMLFDVVVIDLAGTGRALVQPLLDRSDSVVVVSPPTPAGLVRTRRMIAALRAGQVPGESLALCLNRVVDADLVSPRRLEQDLEVRCAAVIPDDATAMERALVAGRAVVEASPRAPSAQAIERLARELGAASRARRVPAPAAEPRAQAQGEDAQRQAMKVRIHRRLVDEVDLRKADVAYLADPVKLQELRGRVEGTLVTLLDQEARELTDRGDRRRLLKELLDEALGLGPLEDLLADPTVTEIMVNRHDCVYVERVGRLERVPVAFAGADQVRGIIERIVSPLGRRIDEKVPMVDARLADGSRVNAVIPPLSLSGPALTIRKFSRAVLGVKDLLAAGTLSPQMALFLDAAVRARLNIVISGGTGSGKTTLLNALASFVSATERIVTIEDAAELRLPQEHVVGLEGRPANIEGEGAITIRDLVRNALRMRPDRIVVGECRGGEALDMLQAMNTGHDGSLTTVHANSASDALGRLETLALMAGLDLPARAIREQIASAIHLVVHQARFRDGSRRITRITEVGRLEAGEFQTRDLFVFRQSGIALAGTIQGAFVPTGHRPAFLEAFANDGIHVPKEIFVAQTA